MKPTHVEHIGIAVKNLQSSIKFYERVLGLKCYAIEEVRDQNVRTAFFKVGETKIELLEPMNSESPVARFIEKRGEGMHHIAFAVDDLNAALIEAKGEHLDLIDMQPRIGAEELQIAFLHPKSTGGVLMELCQKL